MNCSVDKKLFYCLVGKRHRSMAKAKNCTGLCRKVLGRPRKYGCPPLLEKPKRDRSDRI